MVRPATDRDRAGIVAIIWAYLVVSFVLGGLGLASTIGGFTLCISVAVRGLTALTSMSNVTTFVAITPFSRTSSTRPS